MVVAVILGTAAALLVGVAAGLGLLPGLLVGELMGIAALAARPGRY